MIARNRTRSLTTGLLVLLAAAMALSACGRKGPLERPGVSASAQSGTIAGGFSNADADQDTPPQAPERRFILDPLID
ncbi:LPS translocon maturation chaperone LptM [Pararhizobium haloflavum]|uniref:LPS translocon maturation chaperone LptM n=1 Tax=Pararhizobium haloflavum TaxID=2037914 RepID=UPI000C19D2B6|nr:lipoprotein [Pararhizobium haloflavum]